MPRHILVRVGEGRAQEDVEQDLHDPQGQEAVHVPEGVGAGEVLQVAEE